jgi:hypothetical protein
MRSYPEGKKFAWALLLAGGMGLALAGLSTHHPRERRRATTKVTKGDEGVTKPSSPAQSLAQTGFEALG